MTASYPRDSAIPVVGEGFDSLLVHCTARYFLPPDRPTVAQLDTCSHKSLKPLWRTRSEPVGRLRGSDRPAAVLSATPGAARMG